MASDENTSDDRSMYYRPQLAGVERDGTIVMRGSWLDDGSICTGIVEIPADHKDYSFWVWILAQRFDHGFDELELQFLRQEFESGKTRHNGNVYGGGIDDLVRDIDRLASRPMKEQLAMMLWENNPGFPASFDREKLRRDLLALKARLEQSGQA
jgi:hypothetical protein